MLFRKGIRRLSHVKVKNVLTTGAIQNVTMNSVMVNWSEDIGKITGHLEEEMKSLQSETPSPSVVVLDFSSAHSALKASKVQRVKEYLEVEMGANVFTACNVPEEAEECVSYLREMSVPMLSTLEHKNTCLKANSDEAVKKAVKQKDPKFIPALIISRNVRPHERIFAENRSLLILGNVDKSAEVLADESIHILGSLNGRAVAGLRSQGISTITAQQFNAVSVGIAEIYQERHQLPFSEVANKPVCISLEVQEGELKLHIKVLKVTSTK